MDHSHGDVNRRLTAQAAATSSPPQDRDGPASGLNGRGLRSGLFDTHVEWAVATSMKDEMSIMPAKENEIENENAGSVISLRASAILFPRGKYQQMSANVSKYFSKCQQMGERGLRMRTREASSP